MLITQLFFAKQLMPYSKIKAIDYEEYQKRTNAQQSSENFIIATPSQ